MCGIVECAILSVDKKGKQREIHTYGVATSGNAGLSCICLPEFHLWHLLIVIPAAENDCSLDTDEVL
jgi:hypothetical protein